MVASVQIVASARYNKSNMKLQLAKILHSSTFYSMYAFPHVCSERQFLGGQDFDPLQEISQVDGGRLRQLGVLAVVEDVLEPHEQRVILIKEKDSSINDIRMRELGSPSPLVNIHGTDLHFGIHATSLTSYLYAPSPIEYSPTQRIVAVYAKDDVSK